jgi:hypothetical protein
VKGSSPRISIGPPPGGAVVRKTGLPQGSPGTRQASLTTGGSHAYALALTDELLDLRLFGGVRPRQQCEPAKKTDEDEIEQS